MGVVFAWAMLFLPELHTMPDLPRRNNAKADRNLSIDGLAKAGLITFYGSSF